MSSVLPESAAIPASDYVIFGGTGDLATRKVIPALFWRFLDQQINNHFNIFVCSRSQIDWSDLQRKVFQNDDWNKSENKFAWQKFCQLIQWLQLDVSSGLGFMKLKDHLVESANETRPIIYYFALSSNLFSKSCEHLKNVGLALPQSRLVLEKPLGHDKQSAKEINNEIAKYFNESQIYRIDHYLGKETVQNLMALRFANVIFENQWNNNQVDNVQITVAETVGLEGRVDYYDRYGAIKDMMQNHLLQLLCLVAMDAPVNLNAEEVRTEKLRVLKALRPAKIDDFVTGQYFGYRKELDKETNTETYVALKVAIDNWRWAGVPFYLRTGKKMSVRASEIVVTFKQALHNIFSHDKKDMGPQVPNRLVIRVQPDEGLRLSLMSKEPGPGGMRLFPSELNLSFEETFKRRLPDAYERLLIDTARGNQTLFMRLDEVLAAWEFIDPLVKLKKSKKVKFYGEGSMGPEDSILSGNGHKWYDLRG